MRICNKQMSLPPEHRRAFIFGIVSSEDIGSKPSNFTLLSEFLMPNFPEEEIRNFRN
jgi:hypothetical protein